MGPDELCPCIVPSSSAGASTMNVPVDMLGNHQREVVNLDAGSLEVEREVGSLGKDVVPDVAACWELIDRPNLDVWAPWECDDRLGPMADAQAHAPASAQRGPCNRHVRRLDPRRQVFTAKEGAPAFVTSKRDAWGGFCSLALLFRVLLCDAPQ